MRKMLILSLLFFTLSFLTASDYEAGADFRIDNMMIFDNVNDPNFSEFEATGVQGVLAGMDFDSDNMPEILFSVDETISGGPDPGKIGVYLYESDGAGGYTYVWHFITPDPGNSLPGLTYGDIDGDGNHEIYFGVPPASTNENTWGTYIFEQGSDGTFPTTATLLYQYGLTAADNFRAADFALADLDGVANANVVFSAQAGTSSAAASFSFQVGSGNSVLDANNSISITIAQGSFSQLIGGGAGSNLTLAANAATASDEIDTAVQAVNTARAGIGSAQNRVEFAQNNLAVTIENSEAARSVLLDVDVSAEITKFTSEQVLIQAGVSMLAQANQQPSLLLRLLQ